MRVDVNSVAVAALVLTCLWWRDAVAGDPNASESPASSTAVDALTLTKRPRTVPATLQGITELHWDISDRGVGYFGTATTTLKTELKSNKDGTVKLRAIGQVVRKGGFLTPGSPPPVKAVAEPTPWKFDEHWIGHWGQRPGAALVLRLSRTDQGRDQSRDFQCHIVAELSGSTQLNYMRCDLLHEDAEPNWRGEFAHYMRAPLIFSANVDVQASIVGGREPATVNVYPRPPTR
jgi:hypothetical protein